MQQKIILEYKNLAEEIKINSNIEKILHIYTLSLREKLKVKNIFTEYLLELHQGVVGHHMWEEDH